MKKVNGFECLLKGFSQENHPKRRSDKKWAYNIG
jgi:hypothetical protein